MISEKLSVPQALLRRIRTTCGIRSSAFNAGKQQNEHGWIIAGIDAAVAIGAGILLVSAPSAEKPIAVSLAPWGSSGAIGDGAMVNRNNPERGAQSVWSGHRREPSSKLAFWHWQRSCP
jgi:hypothetical protein